MFSGKWHKVLQKVIENLNAKRTNLNSVFRKSYQEFIHKLFPENPAQVQYPILMGHQTVSGQLIV